MDAAVLCGQRKLIGEHFKNESRSAMANRLGIIFDMDDTLVATASRWRRAETTLLNALGKAWDPTLAQAYKGMNAPDIAATVHRLVQPKQSLPECQSIMRRALFDAFVSSPLEPMPGAIECVKRLKPLGSLAVASGSPMELIERALRDLGILELFDVRLSSESVARGKPHPDVFLATIKTLGLAPSNCIVVEDSVVGIRAAKAAGMACIAVPSLDSPDFSATDAVFDSLVQVDAEVVTSLVPDATLQA